MPLNRASAIRQKVLRKKQIAERCCRRLRASFAGAVGWRRANCVCVWGVVTSCGLPWCSPSTFGLPVGCRCDGTHARSAHKAPFMCAVSPKRHSISPDRCHSCLPDCRRLAFTRSLDANQYTSLVRTASCDRRSFIFHRASPGEGETTEQADRPRTTGAGVSFECNSVATSPFRDDAHRRASRVGRSRLTGC